MRMARWLAGGTWVAEKQARIKTLTRLLVSLAPASCFSPSTSKLAPFLLTFGTRGWYSSDESKVSSQGGG